MTNNVKMILDEVNARIKLAEAKTAEDPSNFDSFPGAEHDKPAPEAAKKPDPEAKEGLPASMADTKGAKPGSDASIFQDSLYEADEPVLTPEKKPAISTNIDAKEASASDVEKVAADILNIIKSNVTSNNAEKRAERNNMISLENRILEKIASYRTMSKEAAEYNRGVADAEALILKVAQAAEAEATGAADAEAAIADAAAAEEEGASVEDAPVTEEEVAEAVNELVEEGQISAEEAEQVLSSIGEPEGGEEDLDEEQLAEGIAQAIENGDLTEEEAQQLVSELVEEAGADDSLAQELEAAEAAGAEDAAEAAGAADAAEAAGAADAEAAADVAAGEEAAQKTASDNNVIAAYQQGFIQKCAEYGADPQAVAQYIQARMY